MSLHPNPPFASWAALLCAAALLGGCAAPRPVAPPTAPVVTQPAAPLRADAVASPLKTARGFVWSAPMDEATRKLRSKLGGAAAVAQTTDQRLWISLPNADAFAEGRAAVRPAAGAWLDEVALALRGLPRAEAQIVASADPRDRGTQAEALALDRAASARDWMVMRGVAAPRLGVAGQAARGNQAGAERRLDIFIGEPAGATATR